MSNFEKQGNIFVEWLRGGLTMHSVLTFLIAGFALLHLALLQKDGSNNPLDVDDAKMIPFYPYFFYKDIHALLFINWFFNSFSFLFEIFSSSC
jgi:quinol-cytochrome oxidoreductase complex cytochrome b subunit